MKCACLNKQVLLVLFCITALTVSSCKMYPNYAKEQEVKTIATSLVSASGCKEAAILETSISNNQNLVSIDLYGIDSVSEVDSVVCALNNYLLDNPQCFINTDEMYICISFFDTKPVGSTTNIQDYFAQAGNYPLQSGYITSDVTRDDLIDQIQIFTSEDFPISVFVNCKAEYKRIAVSQAVIMDSADAINMIKGLESISLCEVPSTKMDPLDYEDYVSFCNAFNQINKEKGYLFATISVSQNSLSSWEELYGEECPAIVYY